MAIKGDRSLRELKDKTSSLATCYDFLVPADGLRVGELGRLLTDETLALLRAELRHINGSGIPTRRPNGMNRYGVILDREVGVPILSGFLEQLIDEYVRPLAYMFFPEDIGAADAVEEFAFTMVIFGIVWTQEMVYIITQLNLFVVQMEINTGLVPEMV